MYNWTAWGDPGSPSALPFQSRKWRPGEAEATSRSLLGPVEGYIPRITASRHLIGRASLVISFARSISLWETKAEL
jgi:hypothetical protein